MIGEDLSYDDLLKICAASPENKEALCNFRSDIANDLRSGALRNSTTDIDAYLQGTIPGGKWDCHDSALTELWNTFVADVVALSQGKIRENDTVKPSGPLSTALMFLWHYPTFRTSHLEYGHAHDRTNPSTRVHDEEFGPNSYLRTQDAIPFQHNFVSKKDGGVPWDEEIATWPKVLERCQAFTRDTMKHARVAVFVREDGCKHWRDYIMMELETGDRIQQV